MSTNILTKIDLKSIISVGLDVSKSKIDVCFLDVNNKDYYLQIENNKSWILNFISILKENNFNINTPLIVESTWDYDTLLCVLFSESSFNIKEINPIMTKNYVKSTIRWTKTDKTDSKALANIWVINKNDLFTYSKNKNFINISKKISLIATLEKQIQSLKRALNSFNEVSTNLEFIESKAIKSIKINILELEENIKTLQKEVEDSNISDDENKKIEIINSITWISKYMACVIYFSFAYKHFESKESMYAFIWFDPKLKNSWNIVWKATISKRWNSYVRKKLFQASFCSMAHCKLFRDIYDSAKNRWKHHFVWVICVTKKITHLMFSMLKNNSLFNPNFGEL